MLCLFLQDSAREVLRAEGETIDSVEEFSLTKKNAIKYKVFYAL